MGGRGVRLRLTALDDGKDSVRAFTQALLHPIGRCARNGILTFVQENKPRLM